MKKELIEFIGTFFLVLVITLSGNPIAIGAVLVAMVYLGGYISGAHYNPAVTLAVYLRGKIDKQSALRYMVFQILGATSASFVSYVITGDAVVPQPSGDITFVSIILVEAVFTFALASVFLHVATSRKTAHNQYFGVAMGLVLVASAYAAGPLSGGVLNPAVAIGTMTVDLSNISVNFSNMVFYVVGSTLGGALAASVYNTIRPDENTSSDAGHAKKSTIN
ncbi:MAG: aquaporin [Patescibacteria group bacterium]|nr:aquaporin [Patescibacteria group bacterium]